MNQTEHAASLPTPDGNRSKVQHLLITQFNLCIQGFDADKQGRQVRTPQWMVERLTIFERYCLPSIRGQTERRFTWLLLMDEATERDFRERVEGYRELMPNLQVCYLPPVRSPGDRTAPVLRHVHEETEILVTTRLDNDDALHQDALAAVRQRVRTRREFLNLRLGFVSDGNRAKVISHKYSPFNSFVELRGKTPFQTVYCESHGHVARVAPVRQIASEPLWFRLVHERNVANVAFEERHRIDFRDSRILHRWIRSELIGRVRRRFWPHELRREYRLEEIRDRFHIGERLTPVTGPAISNRRAAA